MKKSVLSGFVIAVSVVIVISFFLPWAKVSVSVVGASRELTGTARTTLKDSPTARKWLDKLEKATDAVSSYGDVGVNTQVSGYDIPVLVNNKSSKVAISAAQIMFKSAENLDMKSYLVYLLPILGILCAVASVLGQKNKLYIIVMILVAGAVSLVGLYNLYTVNLGSLAAKVIIMNGLWFTMYGFLLISFAGIGWLVLERPT